MQSFPLTNFDPKSIYKLNDPTVRFVQMSQLHHMNEAYKIKDSGTCQKNPSINEF